MNEPDQQVRDNHRATATRLQLTALPGIPLVAPGDDLADHVIDGLEKASESLRSGDVLVIAQKIFSKAENRYVDLRQVAPSPAARKLARETEKDPRLVQLILSESECVLRHRPGLIIVVHRLGFVLANAGIDQSNVEQRDGSERVLLLPEDPDRSCGSLRTALHRRVGADIAIVMNDSAGRAWRTGIVGVALGASGLPSIVDLRGQRDLYGRPLMVTQVGLGDELAAAASLLQGQADEGKPVVLIRGLEAPGSAVDATALVRAAAEDLFR